MECNGGEHLTAPGNQQDNNSMSEALDNDQIQSALADLPGWKLENDTIRKDFQFGNFTQAFTFLMQVAFIAESQVHHPNIENVYNSVTLALQSHDAGNKVTGKDISFAEAVEKLDPSGLKA